MLELGQIYATIKVAIYKTKKITEKVLTKKAFGCIIYKLDDARIYITLLEIQKFSKTLKKGIDKKEKMMYNKQALVERAQRTLKK